MTKRPARNRPVLVGRRTSVLIAQLATVALLLLLWQLLGSNESLFLSQPGPVISDLLRWHQSDRRSLWVDTLKATLAGGALGFVCGVLLGGLLGRFGLVDRVLAPFLALGNTLPKVALAPIFITIFGLGFVSHVYFVASVVAFISLFAVRSAWRSVDEDLVRNVRLLGGNPVRVLADVYAPALTTTLLSSARLTFTWALLSTIAAEYIVVTDGIGSFLHAAQSTLQSDQLWSAVVVVAVTGLVADRLLALLERRLSRWRTP